jgi:hypothetical protein
LEGIAPIRQDGFLKFFSTVGIIETDDDDSDSQPAAQPSWSWWFESIKRVRYILYMKGKLVLNAEYCV